MSTPSTAPVPSPVPPDTSTEGIVSTAIIGIAVFSAFALLFSCLRKRRPTLYEYRYYLSENRRDLDDFNSKPVGYPDLPSNGFFAWVLATLRVSDEEIFTRVGLDATMYLRLVRFGIVVFGTISIITFVLLVPLYATGPGPLKSSSNPALKTDGLDILSLANITSASDRIWAAWVVDVVICYVVLYLLHREIRQYTRYRRWYRVQQRPSNYSIVVYDIPESHRSDVAVRHFFDTHFPAQVIDAHLVQNAAPILKLKKKHLNAVAKREVAEWKMENDRGLDGGRPTHRVGGKACIGGDILDSIDYWQGEQDRLALEIAQKQNAAQPPDVTPTGQAFVTFLTKRAALYASRTQITKRATQWHVELAPDPESVSWSNICKSNIGEIVMQIQTYVVFCVILASWGLVSFVVQSLANISELSKTQRFDFLQPLVELSPVITGLIERFLPPVLSLILNLLPLILLKIFCGMERHSNVRDADIKFVKLGFAFQFVNIFLLTVLSGSFLENVSTILDATLPEVVDLLANAVPKRANFFINYVLAVTFIARGIQLSQVVRLVIQGLLGTMAKTERQKRGVRGFGAVFPFHIHYVMVCLIFTLGLVYSTIAPVICVVATIFMSVTYLVHRYLLSFSLNLPWDGGGRVFQNVVWIVFFALFFKQVMMIGVFLVYKRPVAAVLSVVNIPLILVYANFIRKHYIDIWTWGSLDSLTNHGVARDECAPHYGTLLRHPGLVTLEPVEDLSGTAVNEKKAVFDGEAPQPNV